MRTIRERTLLFCCFLALTARHAHADSEHRGPPPVLRHILRPHASTTLGDSLQLVTSHRHIPTYITIKGKKAPPSSAHKQDHDGLQKTHHDGLQKTHHDGAHGGRHCSFKSDALWSAGNTRIYFAPVSDSGRRARGTSTIWRIRQERSCPRSAACASATSAHIHARSHVDTTLKIRLNTLRALSLCKLCVESLFSESTLVFF